MAEIGVNYTARHSRNQAQTTQTPEWGTEITGRARPRSICGMTTVSVLHDRHANMNQARTAQRSFAETLRGLARRSSGPARPTSSLVAE